MFIPRGDRGLGLAYQTHPGNQASSRGEAKNSAVLLSRDGYLLEPTVCPKGSLAAYSPLGYKESDMTKGLRTHA